MVIPERTIDWNGCYDGSWQSAPLVAEAYAHPAKVSFGLAERIYRHMLTEGWLVPGDDVLDPFGGIGGFAFHAALYGMHWTGVELEQRFVDLGRQNLDLWRNRYAPHFPGYGTARLLQGDSRRLVDVVTGAGAIVSSPPYADAVNNHTADDPNNPRLSETAKAKLSKMDLAMRAYGTTPGNLGNMPAGVVSSPPYAENVSGMGGPIDFSRTRRDGDVSHQRHGMTDHGFAYGTTPGQLGAMPAGVVSSPPFEASIGNDKRVGNAATYTRHRIDEYAPSNGNIGNATGTTFWDAAAQIVAQCYTILRPGGYAAWVTGDFVRNKQRVPFGRQWLDLCVSAGFEPALWAVAWKTEHNGAQLGIFGEAQEMRKERVSFFRRLANAKRPETAIVNEDVIFMRKP